MLKTLTILTVSQIARECGRSREAVIQAAIRLGHQRPGRGNHYFFTRQQADEIIAEIYPTSGRPVVSA